MKNFLRRNKIKFIKILFIRYYVPIIPLKILFEENSNNNRSIEKCRIISNVLYINLTVLFMFKQTKCVKSGWSKHTLYDVRFIPILRPLFKKYINQIGLFTEI